MSSEQNLNRRVFIKGVVGGTVGIMAGCWINLSPASAATTASFHDLSI
jgi:hypothetical protein